MKRFDVIIVPGGGLTPDGAPPPYVAARLDRALELQQGEPILLLSAGTVHKPLPLDASGRPRFEAVASARYLADRGLPADRLFTEVASYDTVGNAWFARTIHTDPRGWRNLLVINSEFHIDRTEVIFRWIFGLTPGGEQYSLWFEPTPDRGVSPDTAAARRQREQQSLEKIREKAARLRTMSSVHQWLFTGHDAYAWFRSPADAGGINDEIAKTY